MPVGAERKALLAKMGQPAKSKTFESGKERLFYDDLVFDVVDGRVEAVRSARGFKGDIFSVRVGDSAGQVKKAMGEPDEEDADQLVYYDHEGMYAAFSLDKGVVRSFQVRKGVSREAMEKKKKMIDDLVARGVIASDEERAAAARKEASPPAKAVPPGADKASADEARMDRIRKRLAHEYATKKEYQKHKREARRSGRETETLKGRLVDKDPPFWPVEETHDLPGRMRKFVVEYTGEKDGAVVNVRQECFVDRFSPYLVKKLDSLAEGAPVTVQGRWKVIESKERGEKKDVEIEQHFQMTIFVVDKIE